MAAFEEEREALDSIYGSAFEEHPDSRDFLPLWRINLADHGATVVIKLVQGYPETQPELGLEFNSWPPDGDAFVKRMQEEVRPLWEKGEGCAYQWTEHVREELADEPFGDSARVAALTPGESASEMPATEAIAGTGTAKIDAATAAAVEPALLSAGFSAYGPGLFSHASRGVTVEVGENVVSVTVDGIDAEDLSDWTSLQLETDATSFGERLIEWTTAQRSAEPGFLDDGDAEASSGAIDFLPSPEELAVTKDRDLLIFTWGKALRKSAPADSQCNFNAGILNGRGGGADIRTQNGLTDVVQNNVASCGLFPRWISMVCAKVEFSNLNTISINCTKGRHRSVAAAEILRRVYYPEATVKHLTIY